MQARSDRPIPSPVLLVIAATFLLHPLQGSALAATLNFSGISSAHVASPDGQNFSYVVGAGPETGTLNVRLISGDISSLTTGAGPDPNGFYVLQSGALTPVLFRFTFDAQRTFRINSNETLTQLETNTFTLPPEDGTWTVTSVTDASVDNSGSHVSFLGSPAYGQFAIGARSRAFDFLVTNAPGFPVYGSAISIDVTSSPAPPPPLGQHLLVNGSFEQGPRSSWIIEGLPAGYTGIAGWVVTGTNIDYYEVAGAGTAADSLCFVDLNGRFAAGGIAQDIATTPGAHYSLTFSMAGNPDGGPSIKQLRVSAAGVSADYSFDVTGKSASDLGWVDHTWEFTAVSSTTTIDFTTLVDGSSAFGPFLDNVRLTADGAVPTQRHTLGELKRRFREPRH